MNVAQIILVITSSINFLLAVFVLLKNYKSLTNIYFALFTLFISIWGFGLFLSQTTEKLFWGMVTFGAGILMGMLFLLFCFEFHKRKGANIIPIIFLMLFGLVMLALLPFKLIIESFYFEDGKLIPELGTAYPYFLLFVILLVVYGVGLLVKKYFLLHGNDKLQLTYVFVGLLLFSITAVPANIILPSFGITLADTLGPSFSLFMIIMVAYAITRYRLMGIKVILTQILVVVVGIVLLVQALLNQDIVWRIVGLIIFIIYAFFAYLLIRSVLKEVRRREEIEELNVQIIKQSKELVKKNKYLERLYKMRSEFLDIAGHQLRTPVSVIKGVASMWREGDMDKLSEEKRHEFIESVYRKANKLESIIQDILSASEMDSEQFKFVFKDVIDPVKLIEKEVEDFQAQAQEKGLKLIYKGPKEKIPELKTHKTFFAQIIDNLIDNAIIYTREGSVTVSVDKIGNNLVFKVADTGIGIPEEDLKKLFDKFVRASNARNMHTDGSGLGLFIVKKIVESHPGGKIKIDSKLGEGTTFTVLIPLK